MLTDNLLLLYDIQTITGSSTSQSQISLRKIKHFKAQIGDMKTKTSLIWNAKLSNLRVVKENNNDHKSMGCFLHATNKFSAMHYFTCGQRKNF
jgi:hypothetical protein